MKQNFAINQKVWILQWNFDEGVDRRTVDMPYKILECRITSVHGFTDWDENGYDIPVVRYSVSDEIGGHTIPNDMDMLRDVRRDFSEYQIHDSYDSALLAIIQKIDDRADTLHEMKSEYINMLEEHKKGKQLLDDELFQLGDLI